MERITMCGYRCDLCKAFAPNIKKEDQREQLSNIWNKYYELNISPENIYCDGCRCNKENAKRIDMSCPVRKCVIDRNIHSCGDCDDLPCNTFEERKGLSIDEAKEKLGSEFCISEYNDFLLAYDNFTRIEKYRKNKQVK
ncbi:MAG: DUF3795 domain-containing protein [Bacillota bacterium]